MTWVVVTGAGRGIGRAASLALAKRNCDLVLMGRTESDLETVAEEAGSVGARTVKIVCDVGNSLEIDRARESIEKAVGAPDVVIHNAGVVHRGSLVEETPIAAWDDVIATNLRGPFLLARALLPKMKARGSGRHVFVGSISSTIGCAGVASYAASKWGVIGLAKSLAEELRGTGLISLAVLPGSVDTEMLQGSGFAPAMSADEVARTLIFASLDAPLALNGSALEMFG